MGFYNLDRHIRMDNAGEFDLTKDPELYELEFTSWMEIERLNIEIGSEAGEYEVELRLFDMILFKGVTNREKKIISIPSPPFYRYKNTQFYSLTLRLKGISGAKTAENPYYLRIRPERRSDD